MTRKSKYSAEIAELICDAIAVYGTRASGYEAGGISSDTFNEWRKKYPEFANKIENAEREYRATRPDSQRRKALRIIDAYLNGTQEQVWTTNEITYLPDGSEVRKVSVRKVRFPCPPQILDRVLGKAVVDINEAIAVVEQHGLKVIVDNGLRLPEANSAKILSSNN